MNTTNACIITRHTHQSKGNFHVLACCQVDFLQSLDPKQDLWGIIIGMGFLKARLYDHYYYLILGQITCNTFIGDVLNLTLLAFFASGKRSSSGSTSGRPVTS